MANRRLTASELEQANAILELVRAQLDSVGAGDAGLHWALRRKLYKELMYDERGKPRHRRRLKQLKREQQRGLCAICAQSRRRKDEPPALPLGTCTLGGPVQLSRRTGRQRPARGVGHSPRWRVRSPVFPVWTAVRLVTLVS